MPHCGNLFLSSFNISREALFSCGFGGGQKKVGHILKYKAHILKYVPCIFSFLPATYNYLKMSTQFSLPKSVCFLTLFSVSFCRFILLKPEAQLINYFKTNKHGITLFYSRISLKRAGIRGHHVTLGHRVHIARAFLLYTNYISQFLA